MYELFEKEYKECEKSLFLVAIGFLHNTEDAKDCVQEAVLSALRSFDSLRNKEFFKTQQKHLSRTFRKLQFQNTKY